MAVVYEQTPNPNALKFVVSREVRGDKGPLYYKKDPKDNPKQEAPLAYQLFQFEGVVDVFFGSNFIALICNKDFAIFSAISVLKIIAQMYEVFINDRPLIISNNISIDNDVIIFSLCFRN